MKFKSSLALLIAASLASIFASGKPLASSTQSPPRTENAGIYHIKNCNFKINDLRGGAFSAGNESGGFTGLKKKNDPVFTAYCQNKPSDDDIATFLNAKNLDGKWIWIDSGAPFSKEQNFKYYQFSGKNWSGKATTYDDTTGDESKRGRNFQYCLFQNDGPQVICGGPTDVMSLKNGESTNTLPVVMSVLRSIEFIEPPQNHPH